jgi:hypothetical protein
MSRFVAVFGLVMSLTASASVSAQALNIERFRPTLDRFGFSSPGIRIGRSELDTRTGPESRSSIIG